MTNVITRRAAWTGLALLVAGCGTSRGPRLPDVIGVGRRVAATWKVETVTVTVAPDAQIKWFEDDLRLGDYEDARVADAVQDGVTRGANRVLTGRSQVNIDAVVHKFDALGAVASYVTGGVHSVKLDLHVTDMTGATLGRIEGLDMRRIALGGMARVVRNLRGRTQRHRVIERIALITSEWLLSGE